MRCRIHLIAVAVVAMGLSAATFLMASDGDPAPPAFDPPIALTARAVDASHVDVLFADRVDRATAEDPANYTLAPALTIASAVQDADGQTVHLTTASLLPHTAYMLFVDNVTDLSGRAAVDGRGSPVEMTAPQSIQPAAVTALRVVGASYLNATHVFVSFNKKVTSATAQQAGNYVVTPSLPVTAAVLGSGGAMVRLTTGTQTPGQTYTVTVSNVRSTSGQLISATARTASWTTPSLIPTVTAHSPTGTGVSLQPIITVTFSIAMEQHSVHHAFSISPAVGGTMAYSGKVFQFTPAGLSPGVTYLVTMSTTAMSLDGVPMAVPFSWSFSTATSLHIKVACCGDSITQNTEYPADLQGLLGSGHNVVNFGHGGASVQQDSDRPYMSMPEFTTAQQFQPDTVIIMLGTNDTWIPNYHLTTFVADYTTIAQTFLGLASHPQVLLVIPPPIYANTAGLSDTNLVQGVIPLIRQVATTLGLPLVDAYTPLSGQPGLFPDGIHPNAQGAAILANTIYQAITGG